MSQLRSAWFAIRPDGYVAAAARADYFPTRESLPSEPGCSWVVYDDVRLAEGDECERLLGLFRSGGTA